MREMAGIGLDSLLGFGRCVARFGLAFGSLDRARRLTHTSTEDIRCLRARTVHAVPAGGVGEGPDDLDGSAHDRHPWRSGCPVPMFSRSLKRSPDRASPANGTGMQNGFATWRGSLRPWLTGIIGGEDGLVLSGVSCGLSGGPRRGRVVLISRRTGRAIQWAGSRSENS